MYVYGIGSRLDNKSGMFVRPTVSAPTKALLSNGAAAHFVSPAVSPQIMGISARSFGNVPPARPSGDSLSLSRTVSGELHSSLTDSHDRDDGAYPTVQALTGYFVVPEEHRGRKMTIPKGTPLVFLYAKADVEGAGDPEPFSKKLGPSKSLGGSKRQRTQRGITPESVAAIMIGGLKYSGVYAHNAAFVLDINNCTGLGTALIENVRQEKVMGILAEPMVIDPCCEKASGVDNWLITNTETVSVCVEHMCDVIVNTQGYPGKPVYCGVQVDLGDNVAGGRAFVAKVVASMKLNILDTSILIPLAYGVNLTPVDYQMVLGSATRMTISAHQGWRPIYTDCISRLFQDLLLGPAGPGALPAAQVALF